MSSTFTAYKKYTIGEKEFVSPVATVTAAGGESVDPVGGVAVAWAGTLTTRTDANTGTITMTSGGHLVTTGARVDVYWTNTDGTFGCQRAVTVGTVSGTSVPIDLGIGDNLPLNNTAVIVGICESYTFSFTGDNMKALALGCDGRATIVLASGTVTEELAKVFTAAGAYGWSTSDSEANPIAGDTITKVFMSQASIVAAVGVRAAVLKIA